MLNFCLPIWCQAGVLPMPSASDVLQAARSLEASLLLSLDFSWSNRVRPTYMWPSVFFRLDTGDKAI